MKRTIIIRKQKVLLFLLLIFIFNSGLILKNESELSLYTRFSVWLMLLKDIQLF